MSSRRAPSSSRSTSDKNANFGVPCDSILALLCSLQRNNNSFALFIPILGSKQRGKSYSSQSESRRPNQCAAISKILSHFWWASRLFSTTSKFVFRCYPPSVHAPKTLSRRKLNTNHYVHDVMTCMWLLGAPTFWRMNLWWRPRSGAPGAEDKARSIVLYRRTKRSSRLCRGVAMLFIYLGIPLSLKDVEGGGSACV